MRNDHSNLLLRILSIARQFILLLRPRRAYRSRSTTYPAPRRRTYRSRDRW